METGLIFLYMLQCISISCVVLWVILWAIYDAKCAHTAPKKPKRRRTLLDVIQPLSRQISIVETGTWQLSRNSDYLHWNQPGSICTNFSNQGTWIHKNEECKSHNTNATFFSSGNKHWVCSSSSKIIKLSLTGESIEILREPDSKKRPDDTMILAMVSYRAFQTRHWVYLVANWPVMYEFWSKYHLPIGDSNLPKNHSETSYLLNKLNVLFEMPVNDTIEMIFAPETNAIQQKQVSFRHPSVSVFSSK